MIQYAQTVSWDPTLIDVEYLGSDQSVPLAMRGLANFAIKITTGAPTAIPNRFIRAAQIQNAIDGTWYENTGTISSPTWSLVPASGSGITTLTGDVTAGPGTGSQAATIANGAVNNAKIAANAAIDFSKLAVLTSGNILVGSVANAATSVPMSGDVTIIASGATAIGAGKVTGAKMVTGVGYFVVAVETNGMTPVDVIAATVPFNAVITGVYLISEDVTAGNITIADTAGTVATIAKGTVSGVMVGAASLANTTVTAGDTLTIVSSSAGNARVFITFTVA